MDFFKGLTDWIGWTKKDEKKKPQPTQPKPVAPRVPTAAPRAFGSQPTQQSAFKTPTPQKNTFGLNVNGQFNTPSNNLPTASNQPKDITAPLQLRQFNQAPKPDPQVQIRNNAKATTGKVKDNWLKPAAVETREQTIRKGIADNRKIEDIASNAGLSTREVQSYVDKNYNGYKKPDFAENATKFIGDVVDGATQIVRKPAATIGYMANKDATNEAVNNLQRNYKNGTISYDRFKEQFDTLTKDLISGEAKEYKATPDGLQKKSKLEQLGEFAGGFTEAGVNAYPGAKAPGAVVRGVGATVAEQGAKQAVKDVVKYGAKESAAITTAQTVADALQGREITPESIAQNFGTNMVLNTGVEGLGRYAGHVKRVQGEQAVDSAISNPSLQSSVMNDIEARAAKAPEAQVVSQPTPKVTKITPRNTSEVKAAVDNGIVTPATKSLPVEQRLQTALNSSKAPVVDLSFTKITRPEATVDPHIETPQPLKQDTPEIISDRFTPEQQRAVRQAMDEVIHQQNPELMAKAMYGDYEPRRLGEGGDTAIPRIHTEDLKHYLGSLSESIPTYYKRRGGERDIDLLAQRAGFDDIDQFLDEYRNQIEGRATNKQMSQELRDLRRSEEIRRQAEELVQKRLDETKAEIEATQAQRREHLLKGDLASVKAADDYVRELERNAGFRTTKPPKISKINIKTPRGQNITEYAAVNSVGPDGKTITTELIPLDGKKHTVKDGTVVDKKGKSVGSYVGIDDMGNQYAFVEGKPVNITGIIGDVDAWGNVNHAYMDMNRLIEINAPDKATARRVQDFMTIFKDQQEAVMKTDLKGKREVLYQLEKNLEAVRPANIKKEEFSSDLFRMMEGKADLREMRTKYGEQVFDNQIKPTLKWTRAFLDDILKNTNRVLERNGFDAIPRRKNYMTHIQEDPSFWEKVGIGIQDLNPFGSSISSDVNPGKVRAGVPDEIIGNTADTGARRKWNPFAQTRRGSAHQQDFFAAIDAYVEPMLFNQYMTPAASRARIVERTFRTFEKAKEIKFEQMAEIVGLDEAKKKMAAAKKTNKNYKAGRTSPLIAAWQEYGNMLAGKTNALDRVILDKTGDAGKTALDASTKLQGIAGANTIPGSTTAALAQVLSIPQTIARDTGLSTLKAARDMLTNLGSKDPLRQSAFMRARYTDATSKRKSVMRKYTSAASKPMEAIERQASELSWRSAYHEALKNGLTGQKAINKADIEAKKTLAGRGIGDRPMIMNSKAIGPVTQFGLEVGNMGVQFWKDFTPKQKAKFMVAAAALNTVYGAVTGQTPLPDYIKAAWDTYEDFTNTDDNEEGNDFIEAGQRALGETAKFIPGAPTIASGLMDDKTKETVFGKDSDVGRYGDPAISRVPKSIVDIITGVGTGDLEKARDGLFGIIPTGNQMKRTANGLEAVDQGYVETAAGNVRNPVDQNNPLNWLQGTLFGQYSLPDSQASLQSGQYLGDKQSDIFKLMNAQSPEAARAYYDGKMAARSNGAAGPGANQAASALQAAEAKYANADVTAVNSASAIEAKATKEANIKDGTWKEVEGEVVDKNGKVQRNYYKDLAAGLPEKSNEAYKAYLKGYNLETGTKYGKQKKVTTGDKTLDKLIDLDSKSKATKSTASGKAMALFEDGEDYKNVPDWVKDRYYKDAGYTKDQVAYGVYTKLSAETRLDSLYRPLAQEGDHDALLNALVQGRRKGINRNYMMAQDKIITQLYKEGHLSYAESRYLKGLKLDWKGKAEENSGSKSGGGGKGGRRGRSGGGRASSGGTKADLASWLKTSDTGPSSEILSILAKTRTAKTTAKAPVSRSPRMRKLAASKGKSGGSGKLNKTAIG